MTNINLIQEQNDAIKLVSLLEEVRDYNYNVNDEKEFTVDQSSVNVFTSICENFAKGKALTGEINFPKKCTADGDAITVEFLFKNCVFMINSHFYLDIQFEKNIATGYQRVKVIPYFSFNLEDELRIDVMKINDKVDHIVLYETTEAGSVDALQFYTSNDYGKYRFEKVSSAIVPVTIDEIINVISKKYNLGISKVRTSEQN